MCIDPATMFMIATVASSGLKAYSSIQQGNAAYQAGMYNAQIAERNAQSVEDDRKDVKDAAAIERRRLGERVRAERGALTARFAHMGLDTAVGSPADLIGDTERAYAIDRSILGRNEITSLTGLDKQEADFRDSAAMSRAGAKSARKAGLIGAGASFLDGAATVSSRWMTPQPANDASPPIIGQHEGAHRRPRIRVGG